MMKTILITNDPSLAAEAQEAGVSRIMVDLESIGKKERQKTRNTFISAHTKEDIAKIRAVLFKSDLIVRINPWYEGAPGEIEAAVKGKADYVMLPMITDVKQVDEFLSYLNNRAAPLPLIETKYSMEHIDEIAAKPEINELYIGLNDLHLSLGLNFLFEPLAMGLIDRMAETIKRHGKAFGFGGIAAIGGGELPAELVLGEHVRMGSSCVILSSRFGRLTQLDVPKGRKQRLGEALQEMQEKYERLAKRPAQEQADDSAQTFALINRLAGKKYD